VVIEGTGHAGVGSIFDLSNARVANLLDAKVILVTSGGIGKPMDEIELNMALFEKECAEVIGVIINKVIVSKYRKIKVPLTLRSDKETERTLKSLKDGDKVIMGTIK